jgi:hypothetical protein
MQLEKGLISIILDAVKVGGKNHGWTIFLSELSAFHDVDFKK